MQPGYLIFYCPYMGRSSHDRHFLCGLLTVVKIQSCQNHFSTRVSWFSADLACTAKAMMLGFRRTAGIEISKWIAKSSKVYYKYGGITKESSPVQYCKCLKLLGHLNSLNRNYRLMAKPKAFMFQMKPLKIFKYRIGSDVILLSLPLNATTCQL